MKNLLFTSVAMTMFAAFGCTAPTEPASPSEAIVGKWKWLRTDHAWSADEFPGVGETHLTTFSLDRSYTRRLDDRIVASGTYATSTDSRGSARISFDGEEYSEGFWVRNDTLFIGDPEVDGPNRIFVRVRE